MSGFLLTDCSGTALTRDPLDLEVVQVHVSYPTDSHVVLGN